MSCCGENNNKKAKDWGSNESEPKRKINIPLIFISIGLLGLVIYKFIV